MTSTNNDGSLQTCSPAKREGLASVQSAAIILKKFSKDVHVHDCFNIDQAERVELNILIGVEPLPTRSHANNAWPQEYVHPDEKSQERRWLAAQDIV